MSDITENVDRIDQLRKFVEFERANNADVHIADWALVEIERLQSLLETANAYGAGENAARIAERELLAQMMIRQSLATWHGDTVAGLVKELEPQVDRLRAELSKHQESEFHPDWSMLEATRSSLREHQQMIRDLRAENAALRHVINIAARTLAGEGIEDQGEAYDKCARILDAALGGEKKDV